MVIGKKLGGNSVGALKVLVVDNDDNIISLLKNVLNTFGFRNIEACHNPEKAMKMVMSEKYDIIFMDWHMDPIEGIDIVKAVRENEKGPNIFTSIIMITGKAERDNVEMARDIGVTEFLAKPFSMLALRQRIISIFEAPREFVLCGGYTGPSRRRRNAVPPGGVDRRQS